MTCNTFNNQTSKFSVSALTFEQLNSQLYSFDTLYNMQSDPSLQYDQEVIYATVSLTKSTLISVDPSGLTYPLLQERFRQGPILAPEYADFLNFSQYDLTYVNELLNSFPVTPPIGLSQYFDQLELYYDKNYSATLSGGFCSAFSGKLLALSGLISGAVKLINQLKNFSLSSVLAQLTSIKEILYKLVDNLKQKLLQQIQNIASKISNFKNMITSAANALGNKLQQVSNFFSDLNIESIKKKIEEIIASMAGGYEEITGDVIAYILFRLCRLSEIINSFMRSPVDSLKNVMNNLAMQSILFQNFSRNATIGAVNAGLYRKDPFDTIAEQEAAAAATNAAGVSAYISRPFSSTEISMVNELRSATIEQIKSNSYAAAQYIRFRDDIKNRADPQEWQKVTLGTYIRLFRVAQRMGVTFDINSAMRPPQLNAAVDGAANSQHLYGQALDVSMRGRSNEFRTNFIRAASEEGFDGIGTYPTFIHVDTREGRTTWGSYNSDALALHKNGTYRKGLYQRTNNSTPQ